MPETAAEANLRKQLEQTLAAEPSSLLHHYNLGVFLWDHAEAEEAVKQEGEEEARRFRAAEHFLAAAKLNPNDGVPFRFLGHHYTRAGDAQRAAKCYQRSVALNPDDAEAGEALCDLLDVEGKRSWSLLCARRQLASHHVRFGPSRGSATYRFIKGNGQKLYKAFQHAIRGYPTCADLWEALGLAYHRLGMFTAAVKSYGRAIELDSSRVFALIESGNIQLMLGYFRKAGLANDAVRECEELKPQGLLSVDGLQIYSLALWKLGQHDEALSVSRNLAEKLSSMEDSATAALGFHMHIDIHHLWEGFCSFCHS